MKCTQVRIRSVVNCAISFAAVATLAACARNELPAPSTATIRLAQATTESDMPEVVITAPRAPKNGDGVLAGSDSEKQR